MFCYFLIILLSFPFVIHIYLPLVTPTNYPDNHLGSSFKTLKVFPSTSLTVILFLYTCCNYPLKYLGSFTETLEVFPYLSLTVTLPKVSILFFLLNPNATGFNYLEMYLGSSGNTNNLFPYVSFTATSPPIPPYPPHLRL
jgi:hypothetical protein